MRFSLRNEDLARDFTIFGVDVLDQATFVKQMQEQRHKSQRYKDQAFVFVHGFNVSFDDALFRAAQMTFDTGFDGVPFVFSWPSIAGLTGYILDRTRAQAAEDYLREFIELIERQSGAKTHPPHRAQHGLRSVAPGIALHVGPAAIRCAGPHAAVRRDRPGCARRHA